MWPDRVSNPGPLTYESGARPIALRGPATKAKFSLHSCHLLFFFFFFFVFLFFCFCYTFSCRLYMYFAHDHAMREIHIKCLHNLFILLFFNFLFYYL